MTKFPHIHPAALMRMRILGIEPSPHSQQSGCSNCELQRRYRNSEDFCTHSRNDPFPKCNNYALQACEHWAPTK